MFYQRVPIASVTRLDGEYYDPIAISVDSQVRGGPYRNFGDLVQTGYRVVYHGIDDAPVDDCLRFLAPTDINAEGDFAASEIAVRVPKNYAVRYPKGISRPGELLIEVKGKTEKLAVVPSDGAEAEPSVMVSGSLYKATLHSDVDTYFVLAYLKSAPGNILKRRVVSNINISYIGKGDLYNIPIPCPAANAQAYIGNKLRQAAAMRARARRLIQRVDAHHSGLIPQPSIPRKKLWTRVNLARLAERLDAEHYPGVVSDYFSALSCPVQALEKVTERVFSGTSLPKSDTADGFQATVANLSTHFLEPQLRRVQLKNSIGKRTRNHDLLICAAAHTASYIGKDITYGTSGEAPIIPSTEVLLVRPDRSIVPSSYVRAFFQSPIGYRQIQACVRGITAHLYSADLEGVRLPIPDVRGVERDSWFECDEKLLAADEMTTLGRQLVASARLLIEALIEHNVTETELVAAHKDPEADRALMARLSASGLDATDAAPLFPDFDRLEELLKEAQQGNDE